MTETTIKCIVCKNPVCQGCGYCFLCEGCMCPKEKDRRWGGGFYYNNPLQRLWYGFMNDKVHIELPYRFKILEVNGLVTGVMKI